MSTIRTQRPPGRPPSPNRNEGTERRLGAAEGWHRGAARLLAAVTRLLGVRLATSTASDER